VGKGIVQYCDHTKETPYAEKDAYHDVVKSDLIKAGWTITHDPLFLPLGRRRLQVDLAAEAPLAAERDGRKSAVEVKSFLGVSDVTELERAFGQYLIHRFVLQRKEPDRRLYLALPVDAYESLFSEEDERDLAKGYDVKLILFDPENEVIIEWIEW
jgi:hypothetical protein